MVMQYNINHELDCQDIFLHVEPILCEIHEGEDSL